MTPPFRVRCAHVSGLEGLTQVVEEELLLTAGEKRKQAEQGQHQRILRPGSYEVVLGEYKQRLLELSAKAETPGKWTKGSSCKIS
jgi:hypothetical protein